MSAIAQIINHDVRVHFSAPWDLPAYDLFLKAKRLPEFQCLFDRLTDSYTLTAPARFAHLVGLDAAPRSGAGLPFPDFLFDYQKWAVELALEARRFALWEDCGLGKTVQALEWSRQVHHRTGGKILILCPKALIHQWHAEAEKFYPNEISLEILRTRESLIAWCSNQITHHDSRITPFAICNYEKLAQHIIPEIRYVTGIVLDESSILKGGGRTTKWNLIKSCKGVEYKLSCTATPAPNDTIEYASQASWLEKLRNEGEILWTYFYRDQKSSEWRVRPHAREAFYKFMAAWSIYLRRPSAYGFANTWDMPEPELIEHRLAMTPEQQARYSPLVVQALAGPALFNNDPPKLGVRERSKLSQLAKGFLYCDDKSAERIPSLKPSCVSNLVRQAIAANRQVLVWTVFDQESDILMEHLTGQPVESIHGKDSDSARERKLDAFCNGQTRAMVSKSQLLGYGRNFQFCTRMVFSGFDDSFEKLYQQIRRAHRYGAKERLQVHIPFIPELEAHMWENLLRKKSQWEADAAIQEQNYAKAMKGI